MIEVTEYSGQKVGVFGLGKAGEATLASLLAGGAEVYAWDDDQRSVAGCRLSVVDKKTDNRQLITDNYVSWPWPELKALVLSPGIPLTHPKPHPVVEMAHKAGCPVIGEVELLYRAQPTARYIGISGTNGKSTTTTLIGHILKEAGLKVEVGGNLGTPALALEPLGADGTYVLELSSYQLDLLKTARFNIAVLLNITPDHLDRHGDMEGYIAAKMHIFERQDKINISETKNYAESISALHDVAIVAVDDDYTRAIAKQLLQEGRKVIEVSHAPLAHGVCVEAVKGGLAVLYEDSNYKGVISNIPTLTGRHNWQNAAAAYAAARACGVAPDVIYKAMQSFAGLRHRLQLVAIIRGVRFINDSKATNADATANALAPYDNIYWIAGGKPKAGGITSLAEYFPKIAHAFLIGEAEDEFAKTLEGNAVYTRCGTLKIAVEKAGAMAFADGKKDAVVLLSPACASFDQFRNFEERGDVFCAMVAALGSAHAP